MNQQVSSLFDAYELQIMHNTKFLRTKRAVIATQVQLLANFAQKLQQLPVHQQFNFPIEVHCKSVKVAKGNNYRGLPYVMLDCPKAFQKEHIFAFRSMFWWGHGYSFTLHLGGKFWNRYREIITANLAQVNTNNMYVCVNNSAWEYHFEADNYCTLQSLTTAQQQRLFNNRNFCKLSIPLSLSQLDAFYEIGIQAYSTFLNLLGPSQIVNKQA